jgi:GNAT superfamily N-acetyltransferase
MIAFRPAERTDDDAIWSLFQGAIAGGDAFVFAPETTREEALAYWFQPKAFSFLAELDGRIVGAYVIKPNQPGLGSHVANGAYTVSPSARGHGVGRALGEHSLAEARRRGFRAMQFNAVVSTNEPAVRLWTGLGFQIVGTLPGAFHHRRLGFVDLLVMFRSLDDIP